MTEHKQDIAAQRRVVQRKMAAFNRLLYRYKCAVIHDSFSGAGDPDDVDAIERELMLATKAIREHFKRHI